MTLPFYELEFGSQGEPLSSSEVDRMIADSQQAGITDLIFMGHGFRCNVADARALFGGLMTGLRGHLESPEFAGRMGGRNFAAAGVYWPSKEFREAGDCDESIHVALARLRTCCAAPEHLEAIDQAASLLPAVAFDRGAQDRFVASVLAAFEDGRSDPTEGLPVIHQWSGSDLIDQLGGTQNGIRGEAGIQSVPVLSPVLGGIGSFLNFMSWNAMKTLAGTVGASGLAPVIQACRQRLGGVRIHLAGHSLGGRLMAACSKALGPREVDSLSLLEAAFSHYGFSPDAGSGQPGFFRGVIDAGAVIGPMISTFSRQDAVVGKAYAVASRLSRDQLQAIGDTCDPFGGIGHNGAQRTPESTTTNLHRAGEPYQFLRGVVSCLDGSAQEGNPALITGHGDVTNPHVTYAIASALLFPGA